MRLMQTTAPCKMLLCVCAAHWIVLLWLMKKESHRDDKLCICERHMFLLHIQCYVYAALFSRSRMFIVTSEFVRYFQKHVWIHPRFNVIMRLWIQCWNQNKNKISLLSSWNFSNDFLLYKLKNFSCFFFL